MIMAKIIQTLKGEVFMTPTTTQDYISDLTQQ